MSIAFITTLGQKALFITMLVSAPLVITALVVGVLISIFQAVTQIQEMTLTFVPKILAVLVSLVIFGPWMLQILINFTASLFYNIPAYIR